MGYVQKTRNAKTPSTRTKTDFIMARTPNRRLSVPLDDRQHRQDFVFTTMMSCLDARGVSSPRSPVTIRVNLWARRAVVEGCSGTELAPATEAYGGGRGKCGGREPSIANRPSDTTGRGGGDPAIHHHRASTVPEDAMRREVLAQRGAEPSVQTIPPPTGPFPIGP